jgi:hypothetical protein
LIACGMLVVSISSLPSSEKETAGQPAARKARWSMVGYSVPGRKPRPLARAADAASAVSGPVRADQQQ